jgi:hypothetical protein
MSAQSSRTVDMLMDRKQIREWRKKRSCSPFCIGSRQNGGLSRSAFSWKLRRIGDPSGLCSLRYSSMRAMKNKMKNMVGAPGFEPGASCAQGRRATRLRYAPT